MTAIRTPDQRLRVFISSAMKELATARAAAREAIERLRLTPVLFELGARPYPPRDLYLAYLRQSDVFLGIYGQSYGWIAPGEKISGLEDEYLAAANQPKLVYVQSPAPEREPRLARLLDRIRSDGLSYRTFSQPGELAVLVADDLAVLLSERFVVPVEHLVDQEDRGRQRRLPVPATRFIGRGGQVAALRSLLTDADTRLVTVVGPGGIGKTRLAVEVGGAVEPNFDTVVMVELQEVSSAELVTSSIATALGVAETAGRSLLDAVTDYLRPRRALVVVDNFEHVIAAASVLAQLLARTSQLTLVVTSRERLRLSGERVFDLQPLALPGGLDDVDVSRRSDSVELFVDRALAAGADLRLDDESQLRAIAEICRRLDGLPLAIELAASRARTLGPEELLRRLDQRLEILTTGPRDLPPRQRALRSTIAWSYDLLDERDRRLFTQLGVFAAGFSLEAAEAVCAHDVPDVLDGIAALVDKTLLRTEDTVNGQPRFTMLQVVREYAVEQLERTGDADRLRRAHAHFFERIVLAAVQGLRRGDAPHLSKALLADQANLRAAIRWLLDVHERGRVARMGLAMWPFWWIQSRFTEGIEVMERTLLDESSLSRQDGAHARLVLGVLAFGQGDYERAEPALRSAKDSYEQLGDSRGMATASIPLGLIEAVRHQDRGEKLLEAAVEEFRVHDDPWGLAFALFSLGGALLLHDRLADAVPPLEESIELANAVKTYVFLSNALINLGSIRLRLGDVAAAVARLNEALEHAVANDDRQSVARALDALAAVAVEAGRPEQGATLFGAAENARRSIGAAVFATDQASHEATDQRLRADLDEARYAAAIEHGRLLTVEEMVRAASATRTG